MVATCRVVSIRSLGICAIGNAIEDKLNSFSGLLSRVDRMFNVITRVARYSVSREVDPKPCQVGKCAILGRIGLPRTVQAIENIEVENNLKIVSHCNYASFTH